LFPKRGEANIGVGVRGPKNVRGLLDAMLEEVRRTRKFEIKMRGCGVVPLGGLKKKIARGHVALVGDAAGMVFPSNGGGTGVAMLAGKILGDTMRNDEPLTSYEAAVKRILRPALNASLRQRRLMDLTRRSDALFAAVMWMANIKGWRSFIIG